jgi:hypothetical protein
MSLIQYALGTFTTSFSSLIQLEICTVIHANFSKSLWGILRVTTSWQNPKVTTFSREI